MDVLVTGFETDEQARMFISWFEGQGEEDASIWFDVNEKEGRCPYSDFQEWASRINQTTVDGPLILPIKMS